LVKHGCSLVHMKLLVIAYIQPTGGQYRALQV